MGDLKFKTMIRVAFKMQLFAGYESEYKKRHEELWPELEKLLKDSTIKDYSIFWDRSTNSLFAIMRVANKELLDSLPDEPVMKLWWKYMADIMETNADNSPTSFPLEEVFYLEL